MPYDIWFVPTHSGHIAKQRPLMEALRDEGHRVRLLCVEGLCRSTGTLRQIQESGFPYESLPPGRFKVHHWLTMGLRWRLLARILDGFLDRHPVDALIFGSDSAFFPRMFVRRARRRCIATVLIPDGLVLPPNPRYRKGFWLLLKGVAAHGIRCVFPVRGRRGTSGVDLILTMGEMGREVFLRAGIPPERIRAVGSCDYDQMAAQKRGLDRAEEESLRQRIGLPPDVPVVLFAHQKLPAAVLENLLRTMVAAVRQCGACLLVKFHPRVVAERPETWRAWAEREGMRPTEVGFVKEECASAEAVRLCAACVTVYSTVGLEALICGKPLVLIQYLNVDSCLLYGRLFGAALDADSPEELQKAIVAAVTDAPVQARLRQNAAAVIEKELGSLDGKNTGRMVQHTQKLIELKKRLRESKP